MQATDNIEEMINRPRRTLPIPLRVLERLAWNYWWSWAPDGANLFRDLDPAVWEICEHNPRRLLAETSEFHLMQKAIDPEFVRRATAVADQFDRYMAEPLHSFDTEPDKIITSDSPVAYFCAEYGVHTSLPLYSGGLGILAGDHLKSASDIGLPLVAIGLLYRYGYFRQRLTLEGWQKEHYGESHPSEMPIHQVVDDAGAPLFVEVSMRGRSVRANVWRVDVGRVQLYLLDTNIPENEEMDRLVTGHLYGGDRETRVVQEMMLGIGGVRLLRKLKIEPHVFHMNEGHAAFLSLELARELTQEDEPVSFEEATRTVRERCVFTTHTPVSAGNDTFDTALIEKCFDSTFEEALGLSHDEFLDLGRVDTNDDMEWYGLSPLAIKMSRKTNGVSRKHGEVSRELWQGLFPGAIEVNDVPITSVTNGVHAPTWVAPLLRELFKKYIGSDWAVLARNKDQWIDAVRQIPDNELWDVHRLLKEYLVAFVRQRSFDARRDRNEKAEYTQAARTMFDPEALIIGFARRVAGYKRWTMLLTDPERLFKMIDNDERPVQFIFAGKAHPQDREAKMILQQMAVWEYDPRVMQRAVFLQDYDQEIARRLVQSVDVWLNVPRRPQEASGTSGQKVAMNGGLNLSILDGWWIEGYDGTNGWAVGDASVGDDNAAMDSSDAESLYSVIENEVVPQFYNRDAEGIPRGWVAMMKRSIQTLLPAFNSDRMVEDYVREIYL
jgi:glycogen phosphorylase